MPAARYHFAYADDSPYGHAVGLLARHTHVPGGVVVDLGCGYGAIAEPVAELGLTYVGTDLEPAGLADLSRRGFEGAVVDLRDAAGLDERLASVLAGRPLAALCALDVIEHLTNGPSVLAALRRLAIDQGRAPLVVSIPNVAHLDLAAKLLVGRWDVTPTGLLDETHVALYAPGRLESAFEAAGWAEVGEADFELVESDQHFPADAPVLAPTPLHELLAGIRRRAAPAATTNQFVRAYVPAAIPSTAEPATADRSEPLLSVLVVDGGDDDRLADLLVALDAQGSPDAPFAAPLELLACTAASDPDRPGALGALLEAYAGGLAERARVVALPPGAAGRPALLDAAIAEARGRYVTVLDDGALPFAHYADTFGRLAAEHPGAVLRGLALAQPLRAVDWPGGCPGYEPAAGPEVASAVPFDLFDLVRAGGSPPGSYAIPRACFDDLGLGYAAATVGLEDDEVLARAAMACGVHEDTSTAILLSRWPAGAQPAGAQPAAARRAVLLATLDAEPLLLPAGTLGRLAASEVAGRTAAEPAPARQATAVDEEADARLAALEAALAAAQAELAATRSEVEALRASTSWRVTAPLRQLRGRRGD